MLVHASDFNQLAPPRSSFLPCIEILATFHQNHEHHQSPRLPLVLIVITIIIANLVGVTSLIRILVVAVSSFSPGPAGW
ncbi:unnamed protein product [Amoebophrya sp. A25]|nr:unnamed protein product [Amoebophrya sp. A25]|eukprot:GSA25T00000491001.1